MPTSQQTHINRKREREKNVALFHCHLGCYGALHFLGAKSSLLVFAAVDIFFVFALAWKIIIIHVNAASHCVSELYKAAYPAQMLKRLKEKKEKTPTAAAAASSK